jgi:hypothetical protein
MLQWCQKYNSHPNTLCPVSLSPEYLLSDVDVDVIVHFVSNIFAQLGLPFWWVHPLVVSSLMLDALYLTQIWWFLITYSNGLLLLHLLLWIALGLSAIISGLECLTRYNSIPTPDLNLVWSSGEIKISPFSGHWMFVLGAAGVLC